MGRFTDAALPPTGPPRRHRGGGCPADMPGHRAVIVRGQRGQHMLTRGGDEEPATSRVGADHGGPYPGFIGGPAARLAQGRIRKVDVIEYSELEMEAIWRIEVENVPAFIVVDDKGNNVLASVTGGTAPAPVGSTIPARTGAGA